MRHLRANVHRVLLRGESIQILAIGFPSPGDALVKGGTRDVLYAFHDLDKAVVLVRGDRGEPDTTVAENDGCDAVPDGGCHGGVPGNLTVVVGVNVDKPGRDNLALRIDRLRR